MYIETQSPIKTIDLTSRDIKEAFFGEFFFFSRELSSKNNIHVEGM